jgi:DNA-directed RNA polymerase subunit RPC12/RpoP
MATLTKKWTLCWFLAFVLVLPGTGLLVVPRISASATESDGEATLRPTQTERVTDRPNERQFNEFSEQPSLPPMPDWRSYSAPTRRDSQPELPWQFYVKFFAALFGGLFAAYLCYLAYRFRCPQCRRFRALKETGAVAQNSMGMKCEYCGHFVWREAAINVYHKCVNCRRSWPVEPIQGVEPKQEVKCQECGHTLMIVVHHRGGEGGCYG